MRGSKIRNLPAELNKAEKQLKQMRKDRAPKNFITVQKNYVIWLRNLHKKRGRS